MMKSVLLFFSLVCVPLTAQAWEIKNLDTVPHQVEVMQGSTNIQLYTIEPGRTLRVPGPEARARVVDRGRFQRIYVTDVYAIWPEGRLYPQFRRSNNNR